MRYFLQRPVGFICLFLLLPLGLFAHSSGEAHSHDLQSVFLSGFTHPISGLDHILAMLAVGVWAYKTGGKAVYSYPAAFVGFMVVGGLLGLLGMPFEFVETGIVLSVVLLGVLIAFSFRMPIYVSCGVTALFAMLHGFAHGAEMVEGSSVLGYSLGFVLMTILLHVAGLGVGALLSLTKKEMMFRLVGGGITVAGISLWVL